jgi:ABC-2 type transport system ATP-binding protein
MLCDRVLIINEGRIVAEDTPKNLADGLQGVDRLEVEVGGPAAEVLPVLKAIRGVTEVSHINQDGRHTYMIQAHSGQDLRDAISQEIVSNGWSLRGLQMVGMSLEEIFLRLTTHEEL